MVQFLDPTGLASSGALGSPVVRSPLRPPPVASAEALGDPQLVRYLDPTGLASAEALGDPQLVRYLDPGGVVSAEALGTPVVRSPLLPPGVASAAAFGAAVVRSPLLPGGVATGEAVGLPVLGWRHVDPTAVPGAEAFGAPALLFGPALEATGVEAEDAYGRPLVTGTAGLGFVGVMDDVRLFSQPGGVDLVAEQAHVELDGNEAGLVAYYRFGAGTGSTVFNSAAGGGHDGTHTCQWVGFEGLPAHRGQHKPRVWGVRRRRAGVWVDTQRLVWLVNAGPTQAVVPYDSGLEGGTANPASLINDGIVSNVYDWTPVAGHYVAQLVPVGLVRFGSQPGKVAFDVWGSLEAGNYTDNGPDIMEHLARASGLADAEVDAAAVAVMAALRVSAVGLDTGEGEVTVQEALNKLADTLDLFWIFDDVGLWTMGARDAGGIPEFELTAAELGEGIKRSAVAEVDRRVSMRYGHHQVVLTPDEVLGVASDDEKAEATQEWRTYQTPDLAIKDPEFLENNPGARDREVETLYDDEAGAAAEALRSLALDSEPKDIYQLPVRGGMFLHQFRVGQLFTLRLAAWGLDDGRSFRVAGLTRQPTTDSVSLHAWGDKNLVRFGGIASGELIGVPILVRYLDPPLGVASGETLGVPILVRYLDPPGLNAAGALGVPVVRVPLRPPALASSEALGTPVVRVPLRPPSLSEGALGTPVLRVPLRPSSLPSGEALGTPTVGGEEWTGFYGVEKTGVSSNHTVTFRRFDVNGVFSSTVGSKTLGVGGWGFHTVVRNDNYPDGLWVILRRLTSPNKLKISVVDLEDATFTIDHAEIAVTSVGGGHTIPALHGVALDSNDKLFFCVIDENEVNANKNRDKVILYTANPDLTSLTSVATFEPPWADIADFRSHRYSGWCRVGDTAQLPREQSFPLVFVAIDSVDLDGTPGPTYDTGRGGVLTETAFLSVQAAAGGDDRGFFLINQESAGSGNRTVDLFYVTTTGTGTALWPADYIRSRTAGGGGDEVWPHVQATRPTGESAICSGVVDDDTPAQTEQFHVTLVGGSLPGTPALTDFDDDGNNVEFFYAY